MNGWYEQIATLTMKLEFGQNLDKRPRRSPMILVMKILDLVVYF